MDKVIQLQDREGNNLYPISADGITKSRSVLISGVKGWNTETFTSQNATIVNSNDFTKYEQFGPQAKDSGVASTIKVTVPEGETWTVKITLWVGRVFISSGTLYDRFSAIAELSTDGSTTGAKWISTTVDAHTWGSYFYNSVVRTLEAGTYYYAAGEFSQNNATTTWTYNSDETTAPTYSNSMRGPAYTLTAELLEKSGEELNTTIKPTPAYNIGLGTVLAWAEKIDATGTTTANLTVWNTGNWAQYGPMKNNSTPWCVSITAPVGEDWWVKLEGSASKFKANSTTAAGLGIAEVDSTGTAITYLDNSVSASDSAEFGSAIARCMVKIPAGTTKNFAVYTYGSASVMGVGPVTTHVTYTGSQVVLTATLLDKASA